MIKTSLSLASPSSITPLTFFQTSPFFFSQLKFNLQILTVDTANAHKLIFFEVTFADVGEAVLNLLYNTPLKKLSTRSHNLGRFVIEQITELTGKLCMPMFPGFGLLRLICDNARLARVGVDYDLPFFQVMRFEWLNAPGRSSLCTIITYSHVLISFTHYKQLFVILKFFQK